MIHVNSPMVSVLRDNARHDLVNRVATLAASLFKVRAVASDHGSSLKFSVADAVTMFFSVVLDRHSREKVV